MKWFKENRKDIILCGICSCLIAYFIIVCSEFFVHYLVTTFSPLFCNFDFFQLLEFLFMICSVLYPIIIYIINIIIYIIIAIMSMIAIMVVVIWLTITFSPIAPLLFIFILCHTVFEYFQEAGGIIG